MGKFYSGLLKAVMNPASFSCFKTARDSLDVSLGIQSFNSCGNFFFKRNFRGMASFRDNCQYTANFCKNWSQGKMSPLTKRMRAGCFASRASAMTPF